jgi:hypothetical protein
VASFLGLNFFSKSMNFVYFTGASPLYSEVAPDGTSLSLPYAVLRGEASLTINVPFVYMALDVMIP